MTHTPHDLLFVYGTLQRRSDHPNAALLRAHSEWMGRGSIRARLYIINDPDDPGRKYYPGALPSADPGDRVYGDVYRVASRQKVFTVLDDFEACSQQWPQPHEFIKRQISVTLEDGAVLMAMSYLYSWDVTNAEYVASGQYTSSA